MKRLPFQKGAASNSHICKLHLPQRRRKNGCYPLNKNMSDYVKRKECLKELIGLLYDWMGVPGFSIFLLYFFAAASHFINGTLLAESGLDSVWELLFLDVDPAGRGRILRGNNGDPGCRAGGAAVMVVVVGRGGGGGWGRLLELAAAHLLAAATAAIGRWCGWTGRKQFLLGVVAGLVGTLPAFATEIKLSTSHQGHPCQI